MSDETLLHAIGAETTRAPRCRPWSQRWLSEYSVVGTWTWRMVPVIDKRERKSSLSTEIRRDRLNEGLNPEELGIKKQRLKAPYRQRKISRDELSGVRSSRGNQPAEKSAAPLISGSLELARAPPPTAESFSSDAVPLALPTVHPPAALLLNSLRSSFLPDKELPWFSWIALVIATHCPHQPPPIE